MRAFSFGATNLSIGIVCTLTTTNDCRTTTCCRPQGSTKVEVYPVPKDLAALKKQLKLFEKAGFNYVSYSVRNPAEARRVERLLGGLQT